MPKASLNSRVIQSHIPLILASGSPRRQQLLRDLGLAFEVVLRPVDESYPPDLSPVEIAEFLATTKARAYQDLAEDHLVITADTIVSLKGEILGKPADAREAVQMLEALSGQVNEVITGVCLYQAETFHVFHESSRVHFRRLDPAEIEYYVEHFRPYDKAGAYGIQEWIGLVGIEGIEGDFYNVMGLPVSRLYQELKKGKALSYSQK